MCLSDMSRSSTASEESARSSTSARRPSSVGDPRSSPALLGGVGLAANASLESRRAAAFRKVNRSAWEVNQSHRLTCATGEWRTPRRGFQRGLTLLQFGDVDPHQELCEATYHGA